MTDTVQREVIIVDAGAQARKQHIEELERHKAQPLDESHREGGYFLKADGSGAHDAFGNKVPVRPEDEEQLRAIRASRPGGAPEKEAKPKRAKAAKKAKGKKAAAAE